MALTAAQPRATADTANRTVQKGPSNRGEWSPRTVHNAIPTATAMHAMMATTLPTVYLDVAFGTAHPLFDIDDREIEDPEFPSDAR